MEKFDIFRPLFACWRTKTLLKIVEILSGRMKNDSRTLIKIINKTFRLFLRLFHRMWNLPCQRKEADSEQILQTWLW